MYAKRARPVPMAESCTLMHFRLAASALARHARPLAAILTHAGDAESIAAGNGDVGTATRRSDRGESLGNCCRAGCGREQAAIEANGQGGDVETMDFLFHFMLDGDELPVACAGPIEAKSEDVAGVESFGGIWITTRNRAMRLLEFAGSGICFHSNPNRRHHGQGDRARRPATRRAMVRHDSCLGER